MCTVRVDEWMDLTVSLQLFDGWKILANQEEDEKFPRGTRLTVVFFFSMLLLISRGTTTKLHRRCRGLSVVCEIVLNCCCWPPCDNVTNERGVCTNIIRRS